jgi:hypothetical protein
VTGAPYLLGLFSNSRRAMRVGWAALSYGSSHLAIAVSRYTNLRDANHLRPRRDKLVTTIFERRDTLAWFVRLRCRPDETILPYPTGAEIDSTPPFRPRLRLPTSTTSSRRGCSAGMRIFWPRVGPRASPQPAPGASRLLFHLARVDDRRCEQRPWMHSLPHGCACGASN